MTNPSLLRRLLIAVTAVSFLFAGSLTGSPAQARTTVLTNTAHLDFLLADVRLTAMPGHTTYRLGEDPTVTMPWTYADARPGGAFERIGGGVLDPATGHYGQGAFNADDISRAAVVYLRHWRQFHDAASKTKAYELLRGLTYLQTDTGQNSGYVVLWMQSDGTLNRSAIPAEKPDPSDSGPSYWTARTLWALGEGYAAFADDDPQFARFLRDRLRLSVGAVQRDVLRSYRHFTVSDGRQVPSWLIINGADVTAEATLGLSAYLEAAPGDLSVRRALSQLLDGVAAMGTSSSAWPYGAILPWAESRSMWHAWSSQMAAALARGSVVLNRPQLLGPALADSVGFDTTLITAGGPDNAWYPTPIDRTQIAYGVDSRVQDLLATGDASRRPGLDSLAAMQASWFFGANRAGVAMYDRATGVTFDGLATDGTINRNSGAESTIHGLLTMLALDGHPAVAAQAAAWTATPDRAGLSVVEAETANPTSGVVVTPDSAWTGESQYGGGAFLRLDRGEQATIDLGPPKQSRVLEPVSWLPEGGRSVTRWTVGDQRDRLRHGVGARGISAVPGALLPLRLRHTLPAGKDSVGVLARRGSVDLDAVIVRPLISEAGFGTGASRTSLFASIAHRPTLHPVRVNGPAVARSYDRSGRLLRTSAVFGSGSVWVAPGGFTIVTAARR